jgi:hypothetical protein
VEWSNDERLLQQWPELAPRARAVADLTGGNPRLLLMLYQSLELGELPSVIEAFRALLDELTPFYKHVVENRAPQQRKLLGLAAFHDRGASPSELAAESGLPERQVSALLGHLVKDGLLRRVRRPGSRTSAYPFTEPLLRMWLQMRASPEGERRVECVVEFFRIWYAHAETEYQQAVMDQAKRLTDFALTRDVKEADEARTCLEYLILAAPPAKTILTSLFDDLLSLAQILHGFGSLLLGQIEEGLSALEPSITSWPSTIPLSYRWAAIVTIVACTAATRGNFGHAYRVLGIIPSIIRQIPLDERTDGILVVLACVNRSGHEELCEVSLEIMTPLCDDVELLEPLREALAYIRGGRDPYFLEALNPDLRRAVELVAQHFGAGLPSLPRSIAESSPK